MVYGHKRYRGWPVVTDAQYIIEYRALLTARMGEIMTWYGLLEDEVIILCCYCAQGKFCHRQRVALLMAWLNETLGCAHEVILK